MSKPGLLTLSLTVFVAISLATEEKREWIYPTGQSGRHTEQPTSGTLTFPVHQERITLKVSNPDGWILFEESKGSGVEFLLDKVEHTIARSPATLRGRRRPNPNRLAGLPEDLLEVVVEYPSEPQALDISQAMEFGPSFPGAKVFEDKRVRAVQDAELRGPIQGKRYSFGRGRLVVRLPSWGLGHVKVSTQTAYVAFTGFGDLGFERVVWLDYKGKPPVPPYRTKNELYHGHRLFLTNNREKEDCRGFLALRGLDLARIFDDPQT